METQDASGKKTTETKEIVFTDSSDQTFPSAEITSPKIGSELTGKVSISGSAYDESGMRNYKLEYKPSNGKTFELIETSLNERRSSELGVWDTYLLDNGVYDVRLSVTDDDGNTSIYTVQYNSGLLFFSSVKNSLRFVAFK